MEKANVIVCDPPWAFGDTLRAMKKKTKRSARSQYKTLSLSELVSLDVSSIVDPKWCMLCLWVPSTLLRDGLTLMDAWNFRYVGNVVWAKTKKNIDEKFEECDEPNDVLAFGMGRSFRQSHELILIGVSGPDVYKNLQNKAQRSVFFAERREHSTKPEEFQDMLETMFPDAKMCEIFARRQRPMWLALGDAIDGRDIRGVFPSRSTQVTLSEDGRKPHSDVEVTL